MKITVDDISKNGIFISVQVGTIYFSYNIKEDKLTVESYIDRDWVSSGEIPFDLLDQFVQCVKEKLNENSF